MTSPFTSMAATLAAKGRAHHMAFSTVLGRAPAGASRTERIRELLHGETPELPARAPSPGTVTVCSHLTVADGIEVVIDPQRAGLSPEAVRQFIQGVMTAFKAAQGEEDGASQVDPANTNKNERQARES